MNRFVLSLLAVLACATTSLVACNANMSLGSPSGTGGALGEGGAIGAGGAPFLGGFGGLGDASLPQADDATCNPGFEYLRTFPWQFQQSFGGQGGGAADAGTHSGCQVTPSYDVSCSGPATLRADADGMGGAGGAAVVWDDGSKLIWSSVPADPAIISPIPSDGPDQRVWAEMKRYSSVGTEKMCSLMDVETMDLRESEGGKILYMALQAPTLPELTAEDLVSLFGVSAETVPSCSYQTIEGCTSMRETLNDHVLQTTPPQTVPYGQPAQVTTPNGTFSVIWYSRSEQALGPVTACTCSGVAGQMIAFVASRTTPQ